MDKDLPLDIYIVGTFGILLVLIFMVFFYPELSLDVINNLVQTVEGVEWKDIFSFTLIAGLLLVAGIVLVILHFTTIFPEREL